MFAYKKLRDCNRFFSSSSLAVVLESSGLQLSPGQKTLIITNGTLSKTNIIHQDCNYANIVSSYCSALARHNKLPPSQQKFILLPRRDLPESCKRRETSYSLVLGRDTLLHDFMRGETPEFSTRSCKFFTCNG